jgi:hypothetical protein
MKTLLIKLGMKILKEVAKDFLLPEAEKLAKKTSTPIDDKFVQKLKEFLAEL